MVGSHGHRASGIEQGERRTEKIKGYMVKVKVEVRVKVEVKVKGKRIKVETNRPGRRIPDTNIQ